MSTPSWVLRKTGTPIGRAEKMQHCTLPRQTTAQGVQSFPIV